MERAERIYVQLQASLCATNKILLMYALHVKSFSNLMCVMHTNFSFNDYENEREDETRKECGDRARRMCKFFFGGESEDRWICRVHLTGFWHEIERVLWEIFGDVPEVIRRNNWRWKTFEVKWKSLKFSLKIFWVVDKN
jgi:hypothetical protein